MIRRTRIVATTPCICRRLIFHSTRHRPTQDEVGFVHPSQFLALSGGSDASSQSPVSNVHSTDGISTTGISEAGVMQYDYTIFWNRDHKLAISTQVLLPLYKAAMHAFMAVAKEYRMVINLLEDTDSFVNESAGDNSSDSKRILENELMRHSKALLVLSGDFGTAWNSRKLVVSRKESYSLLMEELQLSALILSYSPKSEHAWSHRRWVVKMIAGKYWNLQELMGKESELVEKIAEKSRMNYRAWHHRSWLVTYMTKKQVLDELNESRRWAELHVADNCCFHYRRRLMLQSLEGNYSKESPSFVFKSELLMVWKEELNWDELLIKRYIGREALWVHRRFLSQCWINHFMADQSALCQHSENYNLDSFLNNELQLLHSCLSVSDNDFEDKGMHAQLAASYILWIWKLLGREIQEKHKELGELKTILNKVSPEKASLWEALIE
ncbi:uncharacterized protein LOC131240402 isoform X2 [Magnolia sinica]|uniref:uncharacterized protein LOC131240402 isoform X2 n=1 Tax=Magnolia sinica TaxID=86752 RepID=UPI00265978FC|nr:uncharacterized protein LOC131240402 isoform X2 [Magnolia sinica]